VSSPTVSVVIAAYNAGRTLGATLESALAQTHRRCEIIFVDDGSSDDTERQLEPFLSRVRVIRRAHGGLAAARNAGVAAAGGDYLALLDADDLWLPDKLAVQIEVARRAPDAGLIACDGIEFTEERVLRRELLVGPLAADLDASRHRCVYGHFHRELIRGNPISCPAQVLIPRRIVEEIGAFLDFNAQDYDYYLRIAQRHPVVLHRDSLVRWRYRPDGMSGPLEDRKQCWERMELSVLRAHRARCAGPERRILDRRTRKLVHDLAQHAYRRGVGGDRVGARRELAALLATGPRRATALRYWLRLQTRGSLRRAAAGTLRVVGRDGAG